MMEGKEYYTIDEAAEELGWNRVTVYKWVDRLNIKKHKFKLDRRTFLAASDVERLREIRDKPWLAGPDEGEEHSTPPEEAA